MRVLLLAPHPFFQERGTPIAVDLLLRALSERGDEVDLLTFHEGCNKVYPNVTIHRINPFPRIDGIRPGFSAGKLYCDLFLFFKFIKLFFSRRYDVVHAVEESAFMALAVCPLRRVPFVSDIDSSMTTQLVDKYRALRRLRGLLAFVESLPMRYAKAVIPVCEALAGEVRKYRRDNILVLEDISLLGMNDEGPEVEDLREDNAIEGVLVLYVGNLEAYQGIDLLLESFERVAGRRDDVHLLIIGGTDADIEKYRRQCDERGIAHRVKLLGRKPVANIGGYLSQADILVSPRTQGVNTPMKLYSYLDSGTVVLATDLPTHSQAMSDRIGVLAKPDSQCFADALLRLADDEGQRQALAARAREYIASKHSYAVFRAKLHALYEHLEHPSTTGQP